MNPARNARLVPALCLVVGAALARCSEAPSKPSTAATLPAGFVSVGSADGLAVKAVKERARTGDRVTIVGRIGGSVQP
ncbi:MAG: hypothetical protein ACKO4V_03130, partial [Planctomycetota bacterium]